MNIKPTVGRIVYYKSRGSADGVFPPADRAAIITDIKSVGMVTTDDGDPTVYQVRLAVINPEGLFFTGWLEQGQNPGQWDWMPFQKDQMARLAPGTANDSHGATSSDTTSAEKSIN